MSAGGEEEAVRRAWAQAVHDIHRAQEDGAGEHFRTVDENGTVWEGTMYRPPDGGPRIDFSVPPAPSSDPEVVQTVRDLFKGGQFYVVTPRRVPLPEHTGTDLTSGVLVVPEELRAEPVRTPEENVKFLKRIRAALRSVTEDGKPVVCSPAEYAAAQELPDGSVPGRDVPLPGGGTIFTLDRPFPADARPRALPEGVLEERVPPAAELRPFKGMNVHLHNHAPDAECSDTCSAHETLCPPDCDAEETCSGRCTTGSDIGAPVEYSAMMVDVDPECPVHGDKAR